jgi:hypothetical protein
MTDDNVGSDNFNTFLNEEDTRMNGYYSYY